MQFVRMIIMLLFVETLLYLMVSAYVRSLRTEALEKEWKRRHPDRAKDRDAMRTFVRLGMAGFRKTLRARLVGLIFFVPTVIVLIIIFRVNG